MTKLRQETIKEWREKRKGAAAPRSIQDAAQGKISTVDI